MGRAGIQLDAYLRERGPLPPGKLARIAEEVLRQIIRRAGSGDTQSLAGISPGRILVTPEGRVELLDPADDLELPVSVTAPGYASPEEIRGGPPTRSTALYSLGCACFELLAGEPPFIGEDPRSILHQHLGSLPPDLDAIRPGLPAKLVAWVSALLGKTAESRPQSAEEAIELLREAVGADASPGVAAESPALEIDERLSSRSFASAVSPPPPTAPPDAGPRKAPPPTTSRPMAPPPTRPLARPLARPPAPIPPRSGGGAGSARGGAPPLTSTPGTHRPPAARSSPPASPARGAPSRSEPLRGGATSRPGTASSSRNSSTRGSSSWGPGAQGSDSRASLARGGRLRAATSASHLPSVPPSAGGSWVYTMCGAGLGILLSILAIARHVLREQDAAGPLNYDGLNKEQKAEVANRRARSRQARSNDESFALRELDALQQKRLSFADRAGKLREIIQRYPQTEGAAKAAGEMSTLRPVLRKQARKEKGEEGEEASTLLTGPGSGPEPAPAASPPPSGARDAVTGEPEGARGEAGKESVPKDPDGIGNEPGTEDGKGEL